MANPMMVKSVKELYPPVPDPEMWKFLHRIATDDRDAKGNFVLRRHMVTEEKRSLHGRSSTLAPWLASAKHSDVVAVVARMLIGFGKTASEVDAAAVAAQYAAMLGGLPLWAIERTCTRFASGLVKPAELGVEHIDRSFAPSSAQIAMVARELVRPFGEEASRIRMTLAGTVPPPPMTPEQRAASGERIKEMLGDIKVGSSDKQLDEMAEDARRQAKLSTDKQRGDQRIRDEYVRAGLPEPVVPPGGVLVSLPMMLRMGHYIKQLRGGERVLVGPAKATGERSK